MPDEILKPLYLISNATKITYGIYKIDAGSYQNQQCDAQADLSICSSGIPYHVVYFAIAWLIVFCTATSESILKSVVLNIWASLAGNANLVISMTSRLQRLVWRYARK